MKIRSEISVAVIALATILVGIWGINYLKGRNVLKKSYTLHVNYSQADGLEASAPVLLRGIKIGYVESIRLDMEKQGVELCLELGKDYPLREGSVAILASLDLLGTRGIRMEQGKGDVFLADGDTLQGMEEATMLTGMADKAEPLLQQATVLAHSLDSLAGSLNLMMSSGEVRQILENIERASSSLEELLGSKGHLSATIRNLESLSAGLAEKEEELAGTLSHLEEVSGDLAAAGLDSIGMGIQVFLDEANTLLAQVNSGEGSAGALVYSDSLHKALVELISGLDSLVTDLNENPQDYVHISVFGKNGKKKN